CRSVVARNDSEDIEAECPQVVDPSSHSRAAASAAVGVVVGDRAAGEAHRCRTVDINPAAESVASRAAGATRAAYRQVVLHRAPRIMDDPPPQDAVPGAPAVTAVASLSTGATDGLVLIDGVSAQRKRIRVREPKQCDAADVESTAHAQAAIAA